MARLTFGAGCAYLIDAWYANTVGSRTSDETQLTDMSQCRMARPLYGQAPWSRCQIPSSAVVQAQLDADRFATTPQSGEDSEDLSGLSDADYKTWVVSTCTYLLHVFRM